MQCPSLGDYEAVIDGMRLAVTEGTAKAKSIREFLLEGRQVR